MGIKLLQNLAKTRHKHKKLTHLSWQTRQLTNIGIIPEAIRSSIGGFRSLDNNFLYNTNNKMRC